jgi:hypothetical protein
VLADTATGLRHHTRRELLAQSIGQIAVGLIGGMAGSASMGGTVTAVQAGARRWAALTAGSRAAVQCCCSSAKSGNGCQPAPGRHHHRLGPQSAGNRHRRLGARRRRTRLDAAVTLLVAGVTVGYDLMIAVLGRAGDRHPAVHPRAKPGVRSSIADLTVIDRPSVRQRPSGASRTVWPGTATGS